MPQIGWLEILAVVIIAILVLGPKEFPIVLKKLDHMLVKLKKIFSNFQKEVSNVTDDIDLEKEIKIQKKDEDTKEKLMTNNNSFTSHFVELRSRLIKSLLFILLIFIIHILLLSIFIIF